MDAGVLQLHGGTEETHFDELFRDYLKRKPAPDLTYQSPIEQVRPLSLVIPTALNQSVKHGVLLRVLQGIEASQSIRQVVLVQAESDDGPGSRETKLQSQISELLQQAGKDVVWQSCEANRRGAARNIGRAAASEELLMFLDDDMLLRDWRLVDVIISEMLDGQFDAAMFPARHYMRYPRIHDAAELTQAIDRWRSDPLNVVTQEVFDPVAEGEKFQTMGFCFPGCFMIIHGAAYDASGGFADFLGWGFEDSVMAVAAARRLRIMNLFHRVEPLLHIDHPVTPYKSWEFGANRKLYYEDFATPQEMADLHRRVFEGGDLTPEKLSSTDAESVGEEVSRLLIEGGISPQVSAAARAIQRVADKLTEAGLSPMPRFMALFGSRGRREESESSDVDLLLLYQNGGVRDFYVTPGQGKDRLELELSGIDKFESISIAPAMFGGSSSLELSKLAGARLVYGEDDLFCEWRDSVLTTGLECGRAYWLMIIAGLSLRSGELGGMRTLLMKAFRQIVQHTQLETMDRDLEILSLLEERRFDEVAWPMIQLLDREAPDWRYDTGIGLRSFVNQVPEVWTAIHWLWEIVTSRTVHNSDAVS